MYVFAIVLVLVFFPGSRLVIFAGPGMVHKGRVVTVSDLKEVLKAKTEEKGQTEKEARRDLYHKESCSSWKRPTTQQSVISTKHKTKDSFAKTLPET